MAHYPLPDDDALDPTIASSSEWSTQLGTLNHCPTSLIPNTIPPNKCIKMEFTSVLFAIFFVSTLGENCCQKGSQKYHCKDDPHIIYPWKTTKLSRFKLNF